MVRGCMVYTERAETAAVRTLHVAPAMPALLVHHFGVYSQTRYVESHASAVSLLESGEQCYINDQHQQQQHYSRHGVSVAVA